jgi:small GTP-binding protein
MQHLKAVIVGDSGIGKTCMLVSYTTNSCPQDYVKTVFDTYATNVRAETEIVHLSLLDTSGSVDYDRLRSLAYTLTDVFIIAYSVLDEKSINNVQDKWLPEIKTYSSAENIPIVLVGLKTDMHISKQYNAESILDKATSSQFVGHYVCSAQTQERLSSTFEQIIKHALYFRHQHQLEYRRKRKSFSSPSCLCCASCTIL